MNHILVICADSHNCEETFHHFKMAITSALSPGELVHLRYIKETSPDLKTVLEKNSFDAIILTGSALRVKDHQDHIPRKILKLGKPILGICYGWQWMAAQLDGHVDTFMDKTLHTYIDQVNFKFPFPFSSSQCFFNHHDYVCTAPYGWTTDNGWTVEGSKTQINVAFDPRTQCMGVQFHPEKRAQTYPFFKSWLQWITSTKGT